MNCIACNYPGATQTCMRCGTLQREDPTVGTQQCPACKVSSSLSAWRQSSVPGPGGGVIPACPNCSAQSGERAIAGNDVNAAARALAQPNEAPVQQPDIQCPVQTCRVTSPFNRWLEVGGICPACGSNPQLQQPAAQVTNVPCQHCGFGGDGYNACLKCATVPAPPEDTRMIKCYDYPTGCGVTSEIKYWRAGGNRCPACGKTAAVEKQDDIRQCIHCGTYWDANGQTGIMCPKCGMKDKR